jgi:hypothetical protein
VPNVHEQPANIRLDEIMVTSGQSNEILVKVSQESQYSSPKRLIMVPTTSSLMASTQVIKM